MTLIKEGITYNTTKYILEIRNYYSYIKKMFPTNNNYTIFEFLIRTQFTMQYVPNNETCSTQSLTQLYAILKRRLQVRKKSVVTDMIIGMGWNGINILG